MIAFFIFVIIISQKEKMKILLSLIFLFLSQISAQIVEPVKFTFYQNFSPVIRSNYSAEEDKYIEAATFFNSNKNVLLQKDDQAKLIFDQIKEKFTDLINSYPQSNLNDDSYLAIAEAAKLIDDADEYIENLNIVINNF